MVYYQTINPHQQGRKIRWWCYAARGGWGNANTLKKLAVLASTCWDKKTVFFKHVCCTWMLNMGRTAIHSLKVMQIPSKKDDVFSKRKQKPCKGCRFYAWTTLRARKSSGTVIMTRPCLYVISVVPGTRRGGSFEKRKNCRKKMVYRKVFEMQKQRSVEPTNEHMVVEMPMKWHERIRTQLTEWINEPMNKWIKHWMNESMDQ